MCSLLRPARSLKKQEHYLKLYGLLCAKPDDTPSNFNVDRAGGCYPSQLKSVRFFITEESNRHSLSNFGNNFLSCRRLFSCESSSEEKNAKDASVELENHDPVHSFQDLYVEKQENLRVSESGFLEEDFSDSDDGLTSQEPLKGKASLELFRTIVKNRRGSIFHILDDYVKGGGDLSRGDVYRMIYILGKRQMYGKALQLSEWLEGTKHFEFNEQDYASRLDLIAKLQGVNAAENYINNVPHSFRGELLYRTLLANCVYFVNREKAEAVFEKMRKLGLPITVYSCNQMLILYRRFCKKSIDGILLLMEEENLKPSLLTYRNLIAIKAESRDTMGIEKLVEAMKSQGLQPDIHVLTIMASHYISEGLKDKALSILNKIEGGNLTKKNRARSELLTLYASLDMPEEVDRIWTVCKSDPGMRECLATLAAWGKFRKVEEAEAVFEIMLGKWKKLPSKPYGELLNVYVQNNEISKGKEFVKRMDNIADFIGPRVWDGLVRLYVGDGNLAKAASILGKAAEINHGRQIRPMFNTFLFVMEQYAKLGDIHNTEKWLFIMRQCGYVGRLSPYEILIRAYINAKTPAYGLRERLKAENIFPNKSFSLQLAEIDAIKRQVLLSKRRKEEEGRMG